MAEVLAKVNNHLELDPPTSVDRQDLGSKAFA